MPLPDVAEAPHHSDRNRDAVEGVEDDLVLPLVAPEDRPLAAQGDEHLDGGVRMERRTLAGLGADVGDVEALDRGDRGLELRVLRHPLPDHVVDVADVLGDAGVDERLLRGAKLLEPRGPPQHLVHADLYLCHGLASVFRNARQPRPFGAGPVRGGREAFPRRARPPNPPAGRFPESTPER